MSLIQCPECKKEISDKALTCPNCGYTLKPQQVKETKKNIGCLTRLVIYFFGFIIIIVIIQNFDKKKSEVRVSDPVTTDNNITIPPGCKKHVIIKDATFWAKELMKNADWVQQNHKINIWQNGVDDNRGEIVGKIIPGSRAVILDENDDYYKIISPFDSTVGWVNKIQVAKTFYQNTETLKKCTP